jgi:hypothetical protein
MLFTIVYQRPIQFRYAYTKTAGSDLANMPQLSMLTAKIPIYASSLHARSKEVLLSKTH